MSSVASHAAVDLRCPCCAVHPVMKVYQNARLTVFLCESCQHAWVMTAAEFPPEAGAEARFGLRH